ncbi:MAG: helix-turn-helix domain-containing protein [Candidatus Zhuqueibacterota bacterium]
MESNRPNRFRELREHAGLSQAEFARRMGMDKTLLSRWENGTRAPSLDQQLTIARTLGITFDYLVNAQFSVHFQFRAKKTLPAPQKTAIDRALLDAEMQIHYLDTTFRQAKRLPQPFALRMDFLPQQLPTLAEQTRQYLKLNQRVTFDELKQALTEFNVHIFEWALPLELSGLSCRNAYTVIFINRLHTRERRLFSLVHELAHVLFHLGRDNTQTVVSVIASNREPEEKEANAFAAELLMPGATIDTMIHSLGQKIKSPETIDNLAHYFNVSRDSIFYRLAEKGIFSWDERKRYFSQSTAARPEPDVRVDIIDEQIASEFLRLALDLFDGEQASAGKLSEWFFTNRITVDEYLARRSIELEEETIF